ncbi:MAG: SRPBCC domain-containing protein [Actinomycetota bacterium]
MTETTDSVVIERTFAAPRATVWDMWTTVEHFAGWYGPPGASIVITQMDVEVGGRRHFSMSMQGPDGNTMEMWFVGAYVEIVDGERLVYTEMMSDADGAENSPETRVIVELRDADEGTAMTMTHEGVPADSPGAMGWQMAMEKLDARLAG